MSIPSLPGAHTPDQAPEVVCIGETMALITPTDAALSDAPAPSRT